MAERSVASVPDFTSGERLRAGSADPSGARDQLPPPFIETTTQESGLRDTEGAAKKKLHATFCGNRGQAIAPGDPVAGKVPDGNSPTPYSTARHVLWEPGAGDRS